VQSRASLADSYLYRYAIKVIGTILFGNEAEGGCENRADRTRDWIEEELAPRCIIFVNRIVDGRLPGLLTSCGLVLYGDPA
jgi:hypothetical protein